MKCLITTLLLVIVMSKPTASQEIPFDKLVATFDEIPLEKNTRVTILLKDMKRISGTFITSDEGVITLRDHRGDTHSVAAQEIAYCRLEFDRSRRALNHGLWGGIIGLFAGIPVGAHFVSQREPDDSASDAFIYIGSSIGTGIVGGLIGTSIGLIRIPGDVVYKIGY